MPNMGKLERNEKQDELDKKITEYECKFQELQQKCNIVEAQIELVRKQLASDSGNTDLQGKFMKSMCEYRDLYYQINELKTCISNVIYTYEGILGYIAEEQTTPEEAHHA